MGWQIPELPSLNKIKKPAYLLWGIGLILVLIVGFVMTLFLYQDKDTSLFWLLSLVLPFTLWLVIFTCRCVYYNYLLMSNDEVKNYQKYIIKQQQDYSKVQIPIFGHYIICAEQYGLQALTANIEQIPLYPQKARPLFNALSSAKPYWFLDDVMRNLAQQCPDYRKYLTHIYLPNELMDDDDLLDAIFLCWDLKPEAIYDYAAFMDRMYENPESIELSLLLVCQYDNDIYQYHSKFISAILLGSESLIDEKELLVKSWLGRLMLSTEADLSTDIKQLFTYTQLATRKINDIWISGLDQKTRLALTMTKYELNFGGNNESMFHDIDLTFAKPTSLTMYFVVTMASCAAGVYFKEQLTVSQRQGQLHVQLITAKKLV